MSTRKTAQLSQSAHDSLTVLSAALNLPITKIIDEFTAALRTNESTIALTIARSGRFDLRGSIIQGIEAQAREADRSYYRRVADEEKLNQVKLEAKPTINDIIKDNVKPGMNWDELNSIVLEAYPEFVSRQPHEPHIMFPRFHHESDVVKRATRGQFSVSSTGEVV